MVEMQVGHHSKILIRKETVAAYERTDFVVSAMQGEVLLRIGLPFDDSKALGCRHSLAVVTAYNPFSQQVSDAVNRQRQALLIAMVDDTGLKWSPASGVDPTGEWPPEPSIAVLDPTLEQLDAWLQDFDQNAVVLAEIGKPAVLRFHPRASLTRA